MADDNELVKYFAEGIDSWVAGNIVMARTSLAWCTHLDSSATDAWRGLAATEGDMNDPATDDQINQLWDVRANFGKLLASVNRSPETISGKFDTGLWGVEYKMSTKSDIALAKAMLCIKNQEWERAERVLSEANSTVPFTSVAYAALHYRTKRWADVIRYCGQVTAAVEVDPLDRPDNASAPAHLVRALASVMAGEALCRLERFTAAQSRLEDAMTISVPEIAGYAYYVAGLAARADGDTREAGRYLSEAQARISTEEVQTAVSRPSFVLTTTSEEMIAQRADKWDARTEPVLTEVRAEENAANRESLLASAHRELDDFIGMGAVKLQVRKLEAKTRAAHARASRGMTTETVTQHILFTGPPGTGKTTIARVVSKLYAGLGVVRENKFVESGRSDFVGDTVGSTAIKTKKIISESLGGILFIDEAYALVSEGGHGQKDIFGQEAVDTLVAEMENHRDDLVVIMAGYDRDIERLLATNDGLKSRFSRKIEFHSYTADELWMIAKQLCSSRDAVLEPEIESLLHEQVNEVLMTRNHAGNLLLDIAGNGRFIRNLVEGSEEERDLRNMELADSRGETVGDLNDSELMTITVEDARNTFNRILKEYL